MFIILAIARFAFQLFGGFTLKAAAGNYQLNKVFCEGAPLINGYKWDILKMFESDGNNEKGI